MASGIRLGGNRNSYTFKDGIRGNSLSTVPLPLFQQRLVHKTTDFNDADLQHEAGLLQPLFYVTATWHEEALPLSSAASGACEWTS